MVDHCISNIRKMQESGQVIKASRSHQKSTLIGNNLERGVVPKRVGLFYWGEPDEI